MRIASTIGASKVTHDGETYEADNDGILEVPQEVGEELTGFPIWLPEHEAAAQAFADQSAADNDSARQAQRIADLEQAVAELREQVAALAEPPAKPTKPAAK